MGNVLKVVSPVAGTKDATWGADWLPPANVNDPSASADEVADACITSLHATLVELLESRLCPESPVYSKLKAVLATAEQQMHKQVIPFTRLRRRSLWDVLSEDWLEPHCNFPDTVDLWPPPPSRFLPWRAGSVPRSCVTRLCTDTALRLSREEVEEPNVLNIDQSLLREKIPSINETRFHQGDVSCKLEQTSYCTYDISAKTGLHFSNFPWDCNFFRLHTFADKIAAKNANIAKTGSHVHNLANGNAHSFVCSARTSNFNKQSTIVNKDYSQSISDAFKSCLASPPLSAFSDDECTVSHCNSLCETGTRLVNLGSRSVGLSSGANDHTCSLDPNVVPRVSQLMEFFSSSGERLKLEESLKSIVPKKWLSSCPAACCCTPKVVHNEYVHLKAMNESSVVSASAFCELLFGVKRYSWHCSRCSSVEPLSWTSLVSKVEFLQGSALHSSALHTQTDEHNSLFSTFWRNVPLPKLTEQLSDKYSSINDLSVSSLDFKQSSHYSTLHRTPISLTNVEHSPKRFMPSEVASMTNACELHPPSSSRLTCPPFLLPKFQLLLMLLEPVAHLAASHRRPTHQALCSPSVCAVLVDAARCPDPRVQETAAKAAANIACSATGAALLTQAGAPAALRHLAGSSSFAVQLAACRALLNLRRPRHPMAADCPSSHVLDASLEDGLHSSHRPACLGCCRHEGGANNQGSHTTPPNACQKPGFSDILHCSDRPASLASEAPLLQCGGGGQLSLMSSVRHLGNSSVTNIGQNLREGSSAFFDQLPVYEEGIYPVLSTSDLRQLRESIRCSPNASDVVVKTQSFPLDPATVRLSCCSHGNSLGREELPAHHRDEDTSFGGQPPRVVDVVLLHGVLGGAAWTWRQHDDARRCAAAEGEPGDYSWCWPRDWLAADVFRETGTRLRIIAVNVAEPWHSWHARSLEAEGRRLRGALVRAGVGQRPVVWLAHSHGGVVLTAILGDGEGEAAMQRSGAASVAGTQSDGSFPASGAPDASVTLSSQTAGIVFLSTPHRGSPWARAASLLHPNIPELADLQPGSRRLAEARDRLARCWRRHQFPVLSVVDAEPVPLGLGLSVRPVPHPSAAAGVGETVKVASNHLDICKPRTRSCDVYKVVLNFCLQTTSTSR